MKINNKFNIKFNNIKMEYRKEKKRNYFIKAYYEQGEIIITKILDKEFIKKNRNKCKIIYKNKLYELKEYFEDIDSSHKGLIKFKLIFIHNIIDMKYIFFRCDSLISLSDNNEMNINNSYLKLYIINMNHMFFCCKSLISLPDISKWNTINVINMKDMFCCGESLISLPDISKWNTSYVINMSDMFHKCNSLISLPDISKWNTSHVKDMSNMFYGCSSLVSLPDITKWNISNVKDMSNMLYGCKSLPKLPDFYILNKGISCVIFELTYQKNKYKKNKIRILGEKFCKRLHEKSRIIYNNCEFELKEYFNEIDNNNNNENIIKLLLFLDKKYS